jgi:integrase
MSAQRQERVAPDVLKMHSRSCPPRGRCACAGNYLVRVWDAVNRRRVSVGTFATLEAAVAARADYLERQGPSAALASRVAGPTLGEAFATFLDGAERGTVLNRSGDAFKPSVVRSYAGSWRLHVEGTPLAGMPVRQVTSRDLQGFVDGLVARQPPMSASAVRNVMTAVGALYTHMVARGEVDVHPGRGVRWPRPTPPRADVAISMAELARLIEALPNSGDRVLVGLAGYGGLRLGEALALTWEDVDLEGAVITVRRSWDPVARQMIATKSRRVRSVPISPELRALLAAHALASGRRQGLVLGHDGVRPASDSALRSRCYRTWDRATLQRLRIHSGRHSAVSAWLAGGAPIKVVSAIAGHSSVTTTVDRYGHLMRGDLQLAAEAMARSVKRSR